MTEKEELQKETRNIRMELLELQKNVAHIYNHLNDIEAKIRKMPKEGE